MKLISLFVLVICFLQVKCYNENELCEYTEIGQGTCVNIYYTGEGFYKICCFHKLPNHNKSLGFVTDRNDTIIYIGHTIHYGSFEVFRNGSINSSIHYLDRILETCENDTTETPENQISCNIKQTQVSLGIKSGDLNLTFRCKVLPIADESDVEEREDNPPSYIFDIPYNKPPPRE